ncbi:glycosyltransferase family 2 protein [Sphingomonas sp. MMS24-JH45]
MDIVVGCFLLIATDLWRELGGFDGVAIVGEDADLCLRARRLGYRPTITPDAQIMHLVGASVAKHADKVVAVMRAKSQLVRDHWSPALVRLGLAQLWLWAFARRIGASVSRDPEQRTRLRQIWDRRRDWLAGFPTHDEPPADPPSFRRRPRRRPPAQDARHRRAARGDGQHPRPSDLLAQPGGAHGAARGDREGGGRRPPRQLDLCRAAGRAVPRDGDAARGGGDLLDDVARRGCARRRCRGTNCRSRGWRRPAWPGRWTCPMPCRSRRTAIGRSSPHVPTFTPAMPARGGARRRSLRSRPGSPTGWARASARGTGHRWRCRAYRCATRCWCR